VFLVEFLVFYLLFCDASRSNATKFIVYVLGLCSPFTCHATEYILTHCIGSFQWRKLSHFLYLKLNKTIAQGTCELKCHTNAYILVTVNLFFSCFCDLAIDQKIT
jgi:hypothetical protein